MAIVPRVLELLREKGVAEQITLVVGGIIPDADIEPLKKAGVAEVFQPGSSSQDIIAFIQRTVKKS
jgi:methylmalonyl-CoA mutase C-terminal domain/subunit